MVVGLACMRGGNEEEKGYIEPRKASSIAQRLDGGVVDPSVGLALLDIGASHQNLSFS